MSEREVEMANYILANIQKDLGFLKDRQFLNAQVYNDIVALLPARVAQERNETIPRPPLPTRKSATPSPMQQPIPQPREPSFPKLPVRRTPSSMDQPNPPPAVAVPVTMPVAAPSPLNQHQPATEATPPPPPPAYSPPSQPANTIATAEALYDYKGDDPSTDLSFRQGDVIYVTEYVNADWWRGTLNGKSGIFPQNHVQKIANPSPPIQAKGPTQSTPLASAVNVSNTSSASSTQLPYSYPPPPTGPYYAPPPAQPYIPAPSTSGAPPPVAAAQAQNQVGEHGEEGSKVQNMAKKFGGNVATAATWGFGATLGGEVARAIF
ncbi:hypothetical protein EC973_000272 [Apophysomyces ossiformis]|uniref:SH3 domain-containing protein n=1 Tax=Apophysomyces ossiformis TaxID=679940 RepID=A0A8H7BYT7_9FUNG|nr:hypothetical protein EC973_000272 [Apophysomyces ossiformis]